MKKRIPLIGGKKSKKVLLIVTDDGQKLVKKVYDKRNPNHVRNFNIEIKLLKHLEGCPFVPKLLKVDKDKCTLYITYCGKNPPHKTSSVKKRIRDLMIQLERDWGLTRGVGGTKTYDVYIKNICIDDHDKMFIIDFGSTKWKITYKN